MDSHISRIWNSDLPPKGRGKKEEIEIPRLRDNAKSSSRKYCQMNLNQRGSEPGYSGLGEQLAAPPSEKVSQEGSMAPALQMGGYRPTPWPTCSRASARFPDAVFPASTTGNDGESIPFLRDNLQDRENYITVFSARTYISSRRRFCQDHKFLDAIRSVVPVEDVWQGTMSQEDGAML